MSTEANKVLVRRYRVAHNTNNLALLDEIVAADIKSHSGLPAEQEECLEYNNKGEHYANVSTSVPHPWGCRICWVHHYRSNAERRTIEKKRNQYHDRV